MSEEMIIPDGVQSAETENAEAALAEQRRLLDDERKAFATEQAKFEKEKASVEQMRAAAEKTVANAEQARASVSQDRESLKQEKEQLKQEKLQHQGEKAKLEQEKRALETQKKMATDRDRALMERETNAELGFDAQNQKSLEQLKGLKAQLQKEIEKQRETISANQREAERLRQAAAAELDKWAEEYRESKRKQADAEAASMRTEAESQLEMLKRSYEETVKLRDREFELTRKQLELQFGELQAAMQSQLDTKKAIEEQQAGLEARKFEVKMERKLLDEQLSSMSERIQSQVEERVREVSARLRDKEKAELEWIRKVSLLQEELDDLRQAEALSEGRSKQELLEQIERQHQELKSLRHNQRTPQDLSLVAELEAKSRNYEELRRFNRELQEMNAALMAKEHSWMMSSAALQQQKEQRENEERRREALLLQVLKYEEDVKKLKIQFDQSVIAKDQARIVEYIEQPHFPRDDRMRRTIAEIEWLDEIYEKCMQTGIRFNKRLLYSFHTALKTSDMSPLTILAGVSGTGKSELPSLYSRYGGLYFLSLPVKPDWDSPQSLFGYFNSIDNKYHATTLLWAMTQFQNVRKDGSSVGSLSDSMMIVLLDEMNLAHVELYFSDLLSKLESRRGDPYGQSIEIDTGADQNSKYQVLLSRNVLWTGTMNEDETTKSLSDKVLDRGNLINFPRPVRFERRQQFNKAPEGAKLQYETWQSWMDQKYKIGDELDEYKLKLEEINGHLEAVGRALGHRVWQSIENYVGNHPKVIQAGLDNDEAYLRSSIQSAFEEALVHKVMPKLRGIETTGSSATHCLEPIEAILSDIAPGLVTDYRIANDTNFGFFVWKSAKYLDEQDAER